MAISIENFMGKASGKLGNLIIYQRNGKVCFRSKPKKNQKSPRLIGKFINGKHFHRHLPFWPRSVPNLNLGFRG